MKLKSFLGYKEVYGREPEESELTAILRKYPLLAWFRLLDYFERAYHQQAAASKLDDLQVEIVTKLFPNSIKEAIARLAIDKNGESRFPITPVQIENIKKMAVLFCDDNNDATIPINPLPEQVVQALLITNSLSEYPIAAKSELEAFRRSATERDRLLPHLLRLYYLYLSEGLCQTIVRYHQIIDKLNAPAGRSRKFFDIGAVFKSITGVDILRFFAIGFTFLSNWLRDIQQPSNVILNVKEWIKNCRIPADEVRSVMNALSLPLDECRKGLQQEFDAFGWRTASEIIKKYPFIRITDNKLICCSMRYAMNKISSGLFFTVLDGCRDNKQKNLFTSYFGGLFEDYVFRILNPIYGIRLARGQHYINQQGNRVDSTDFAIDCGNTLIVVECKTGRPSLKVRQQGDLNSFIGYLESNVGVVHAAEQLDTVLTDAFQNYLRYFGRRAYSYSSIFPIVLLAEQVPLHPLTVHLVEERLKEKKLLHNNPNLSGIGAFQIIHVSELEDIASLLTSKELPLIIRDKIGSQFNEFSYSAYLNAIYPDLEDTEGKKRFLEIGEAASQYLFHSAEKKT